MSSASSSSSSALIAKPNLIKLRIRFAKTVGSSNEKPEVNKLVSYNNQTKSLTVLSDLSTSAFSLNDLMIGCPGLTSNVFLDDMYEPMEESRKACAFIIRSMLAVHPYSPVTSTHGESTIRLDTTTFSTLSSKTSFINLHNPSVLAFSSSNNFFSSSVSSMAKPSLEAQINFLSSYSFNC